MVQSWAWVVSVSLVALVALLFVVAAVSQKPASDAGALVARSYSLRKVAFWVVLVLVAPVVVYTLTLMPYAAEKRASGQVQVVDVTGHMWYWELSRQQLEAGIPVHFRVTAADVNHGFGLYNEDLELVAQTQAMPGYINTLEVTFDSPGTYQVLCLEYCGLVHHQMMATIEVAHQVAARNIEDLGHE